MATETSIRKVSKAENKQIPAGAKILSKENRVTVEEIENGFLICKSTDVRYTLGTGKDAHTEYAYITKRWFSKEDPLEIKLNNKDKSLADAFNDD
jgi:plasmid rolling circle replication initiator protein Rep